MINRDKLVSASMSNMCHTYTEKFEKSIIKPWLWCRKTTMDVVAWGSKSRASFPLLLMKAMGGWDSYHRLERELSGKWCQNEAVKIIQE